MILEASDEGTQRTAQWAGRVGLILESPELIFDLSGALGEIGADCAFRLTPGATALEIASIVEREHVNLVFVELSRVQDGTAEWIRSVRAGSDMPLIVAVNKDPDPPVMIEAVRGGANEFLSLPVRTGLYDALDRLTMLLESRRAAAQVRGRMAGFLSAKGGCGATTVACHLSMVLGSMKANPAVGGKVLIADVDPQSSSAHRILRVRPGKRVSDAFEHVRRLNSICWPEFTTPCGDNLDLLAGWETGAESGPPLSEPWRIEGVFRFLSRNYSWVVADLGRNLNPAVWAFLRNLDELFLVTAPDVLALYQTRSMLQTLMGRGFDRGRLHLILNRNRKGPQDFWIESIRKMFDMNVIAAIPEDPQTLERLPRDRFEFPASSPFGRSITKLAGALTKPAGKDAGRKAH